MTTSEQARADAMADAETLRIVAGTEWPGRTSDGSPFVLAKANARRGRGRASLAFHIRRGRTYSAYALVMDAAHEAFRAVPGLR